MESNPQSDDRCETQWEELVRLRRIQQSDARAIQAMTAQRDELLAALRQARAQILYMQSHWCENNCESANETAAEIDAAIAKAEGRK